MEKFQLDTLVLGIVQTNCYVISNSETKEAIVIDPADNAERIEQLLKGNDLECKGILLTHGHFDHILAATELSQSTGAPVYAHENEITLLTNPKLNASSQIHRECELIPDVLLKDQEIITLAGYTIKVIHTPGHTGGGVCFYFHEGKMNNHQACLNDCEPWVSSDSYGQGILISGDTLFRESIGRSDLPTGDGRILIESILNKLMILDDQVKVYPGHGPSTTIGYERDNNFYLNQNNDNFY
jgi:glyoxylase-like metal-dependent hydrolase (beta-lactamase superfamily II)